MSAPDQRFGGKVAIVTGAAGGIGRASAIAFATNGAHVMVVDVNAERGHETVTLVAERGGSAQFVRADVARADDVRALIDTTVREHGRIDFAHNNAGVAGANVPVGELPEDEWDRVMGVMLRGVFLCMKYEIQAMLANGGGAIVNTASGAGLVGYPNQSAYVASKHGVLGLTKSAALEYGARGIRVNAVCPGTVWSPMVQAAVNASPRLQQQLEAMHPIGRLGTADEIAAAVVWLCSEDASFVLGHALSVDGGYVVP
jgi:NAD(P)-dependent dehydrogenase (short-subunit alcohol dehydrogenase family)